MPELSEQHLESYYVWEPPDHALTVLLNLRLLERLKSWLGQGFAGGEEAGGILLGRSEHNPSGRRVVTIEDCEPLAIEHRRGPTYTLSDKDKQRLAKRIAWWRGRKKEPLAPVGLVRGHLRAGLHLDVADFALFQNYFPDPAAVFLAAQSGLDAQGAFFFAEEGDMEREAPYLTFPFDGEKLERGGYTILRAPKLAAAETVERPAVPGAPKPRRIFSWKAPSTIWPAVAALALLMIVAGRYWSHQQPHGPTSAAFGMNVEHSGRVLRLTWDPHAPALQQARDATLWINDGGTQRRMDLSARELSRGSTLYVPVSDDVNFRLAVRNGETQLTDSVRSLAPIDHPLASIEHPPAAPPEPLRTPEPRLEPRLAPIEQNESADRQADRQPARSPEPKREQREPNPPAVVAKNTPAPAPVAALTPRASEPEPQAAPTQVEQAPSEFAKREPAPSPRMQQRRPVVLVSYEAAPESTLRKGLQKIQKIPGVRFLPLIGHRGDSFTPPKPVRDSRPQVSPSLARALPGERRVDLKASVDKHGRVADLELLTPQADKRLVELAAGAIDRWEFEPAQLNGRSVASDLIVTFRFRNPPLMAESSDRRSAFVQ
jgi:outer membrane biosynthesis protein TonB